MPDREEFNLPELDYGEGKTRQQDADDSMAMLGLVLVALFLAVIIAAVVAIVVIL